MPKGNNKTEGGSGGKLGHSNMSHWELTEEIKRDSKKLRRENEKREIKDETDALDEKQDKAID